MLKNVGLSYGPFFRTASESPGQSLELSYDHFLRTCIRRRPYVGIGLGVQRFGPGEPWLGTARFSVCPYRVLLTRRWVAFTLVSLRVGHWAAPGASSDFLRPEVGVMIMQLNHLFSPKLVVQYGRDVAVGGATEEVHAQLPSSVISVQLGMTLNLGTLRARKWQRRYNARTTAPGS